MRKRDRLKNRLKRMMGAGAESQAPAVVTPRPPAPPPVQAAPPPAPVRPAPAPSKAADSASDPEEDEMAKKAAKHVERTRVAMLKFVIEQGGEASMADMHELSERRYFIGHKRFSFQARETDFSAASGSSRERASKASPRIHQSDSLSARRVSVRSDFLSRLPWGICAKAAKDNSREACPDFFELATDSNQSTAAGRG